ncbi:MAG: hypothetical protein AAFO88_06845 [Pseudomonadota bacterium]
MTLTVITPPDALPVPDADVKAFLRIGHDGEDDLVTELNAAATRQVESTIGQVLVTQVLEREFKGWPAAVSGHGALLLPGPASALLSVTILSDSAGSEDVSGRFRLFNGRLVLRPWSIAPPVPVDGCVRVRFEAGYGPPDDVPEDLALAIKLMAAEAYSSRTAGHGSGNIPQQAEEILAVHRRVRL